MDEQEGHSEEAKWEGPELNDEEEPVYRDAGPEPAAGQENSRPALPLSPAGQGVSKQE